MVLIIFSLLLVELVAMVLLVVGFRTGMPPGKMGIRGTGLDRSQGLYRIQMASLAVLLVACLVAAACLW